LWGWGILGLWVWFDGSDWVYIEEGLPTSNLYLQIKMKGGGDGRGTAAAKLLTLVPRAGGEI